jgi:hypothetical protein
MTKKANYFEHEDGSVVFEHEPVGQDVIVPKSGLPKGS